MHPAPGESAARKNYLVAQLTDIPPVACPCGDSRRAFVGPDNATATLHLVTIKTDSQVHYHKKGWGYSTHSHTAMKTSFLSTSKTDMQRCRPLTCILSPADGGEELSPLPLAGEGQGEGGFFRLPTCLALAFYLLALNHTHAAEITIAGKPYATLVDALNAAATTS